MADEVTVTTGGGAILVRCGFVVQEGDGGIRQSFASRFLIREEL
jgi:hypothetical protein